MYSSKYDPNFGFNFPKFDLQDFHYVYKDDMLCIGLFKRCIYGVAQKANP